MSTIRKSSSPSRPTSPTKESLKPNPHPYAIRTSSSALLSRSNSTSKNHDSSHHFIPQTPPSTSPGSRKHHSGHHRHRYSSSLSSDLPRPLPVPPSPSKETAYDLYSSAPLTLEDLPPNPKLWTPSQLCSYLSTALRVKSGESLQLPSQVARDIAAFVRDSKITGKVFLRLESKDLEMYGVNKLWKDALLRASQTLRQNVLKGHIWGFVDDVDGSADNGGMNFPSVNNIVHDEEFGDGDDDDSTPHRRRRSTSQPQSIRSRFHSTNGGSTIKPSPFPNGLPVYSSASSSSSTEDLFSPPGISPMISYSANHYSDGGEDHTGTRHSHTGRSRNGRVKGMVDTFERSASFDENDPTSVKLLQEIKDMREMDLDQLRKLRRERSGSTSSVSSESFSGSFHSPTSSSDGSDLGGAADVIASPVEEYNVSTITSSRPLPTPPQSGRFPSSPSGLEEPSIEELLAQDNLSEDVLKEHPSLAATFKTKTGSKGSFAKSTFSISKGKGKAKKRGGVYAWEDEAEAASAPGKATAKRVPSQVPVPGVAQDIFGDDLISRAGIIREELSSSTSPGSGNSDGASSFAPASDLAVAPQTPSRPLPDVPLHPSLVSLPEPDLPSLLNKPPLSPPLGKNKGDDGEEQMLIASIAETTELLRSFEVRLGEVERKVDVLETEVRELEEASAAKAKANQDLQKIERDVQTNSTEEALPQEVAPKEEDKDSAFFSQWPVVRKVWNGLLRSPNGQPRSRLFDQKHWAFPPNLDPQTLSQLPPYVLLVGLGVCAVVLKVVAKRFGGRR